VARGVLELQPCFQVLAVASGVAAWDAQRHRCTPASVVPPALASRHRLVLVGGLGSSSHQAAVDDVPAARMGYAPGDVTRFSYTGGTVGEHAYAPADTEADLRRSGERLRALLTDLARREPGVPVDVIAHSQGGVVTRVALGDEVDHADPALPPLGTVVTLGSPHDGANLATALALLRHAPAGRAALGGARRLSGTPLDPGSRAIRQLAETSSFMRRLASRPVPPRIRFTSIGARGDLVVPAPQTHLPGANNVVVPVAGVLHDHDRLPSSPAAQREMALAVDGMPPTCQGLGDAVGDAVVGRGIAAGEDLAGGALFGAAEAAVPGWVP
jgi:hypothetical protein